MASTPKKKQKKPTRKRAKQNKNDYSIVKACPELTELMQGEIVHLSFDCPKNLRNTFKLTVKANGSSICHVLQTFMLTYLTAAHQQKACFSNTMRNHIVIEHLVVPTYVKERVRRVKTVERVEEVVERVVPRPKPKREPIDYSKLKLESLQLLYDKYKRSPGKYAGPLATLTYELKQRGITP